jgi:hypothetical protein
MRTINCSLTVGSPRDRGCRAGWFTGSLTSKWLALFVLALLAVAFLPTSAFAQANNCMTDVSGISGCTANDVKVAAVNSVQVISGGPVGTDSCFSGGKFSFVANFEIVTTSKAARNNIGLFFGTNGVSALTGTCTDEILSPTYTCPGTGGNTGIPAITCGDPTYEELTTKTTAGTAEPSCPATGGPSTEVCGCGSTSSSDGGGTGTQFANLEISNVTCNPTPCPASLGLPAGTDCVSMPECTSWYQPTDKIPFCESGASNDFPWQPQAIPGAPSKCTCSTLFVPVQPVTPSVSVGKTCNTTLTGATPNFGVSPPTPHLCDAGPEGSTVTYTVNISNTSDFAGVVIDQICDTAYGTVYDDNLMNSATPPARVFPGCTAGTAGSIVSGSASTCASLGTITSSAQCTFQAAQGENATVKDIVSVSGHSSANVTPPPTFGPSLSNQVTVNSEDNPTTATTNLAYPANPLQNACVTVAYNVTVANTSAKDESVTLNQVGTSGVAGYVSALSDGFFGDITTTHGSASTSGSVTGTTCVFTAGGSGQTLAPVTGSYTCQFDGVICGKPVAITGSPSCAAGLQIMDPNGVNANLTGDDPAPNADTITQTDGSFTTTICLIPE